MKHIDDNAAKKLLSPLAGEPDDLPRIDVAETMRRGRQLRRRQRVVSGAGFAVVLVATAASAVLVLPALGNDLAEPAGPQPSGSSSSFAWSFEPPPGSSGGPVAPEGASCPVDVFPSPQAQLSDTDPTGRWSVTGSDDPDDTTPPALYRDGAEVSTIDVPGAPPVVDVAVNSAGHLAVTTGGEDGPLPWAYVDGVLTPLRGGSGTAAAIGDGGRIAGVLDDGARPVVWDSVTADPTGLLMPPGFGAATIVDVDEDGSVLGTVSSIDGGSPTPVIWQPDGTSRTIREGGQSVALRNGWLIGTAADGSGFRYFAPDDAFEVLPAQLAFPLAVTPTGIVVGRSGPEPAARPSVLAGAEVHPLEPLAGAEGYHVSGITDDGHTITGVAILPGGEFRALTWSC